MKNNESKTTNKAEAVIEAIEEQRKNDLEFAVEEVSSMASNIHFAFQTYSKGRDKSLKSLEALVKEVGYEFGCFQEYIDIVSEASTDLYEARKELN